MRYLSPALLFGEALQTPPDKKAIQLERKKLLAELELNDGSTLDIHGESFTKNDIINYFEDLQKDNISYYHSVIGEDPVLVEFLQEWRIDTGDTFKETGLWQDAGFIYWVSPYFYLAFTNFARTCFDQADEAGIKTILSNRLLMTEEDSERSWQYISNILFKNIGLFDHYIGKGHKNSPRAMPIEHVTHYIGYSYIQVIRQLPDSRFAQLKDAYAFSMQHPSISIFNRDADNRSLALSWVETAESLAVSEDVKASISKKLEELNSILSRTRKKAPWSMIWVVILVLKGIFSLFGSGNSSDNRSVIPMQTPLYLGSSSDTSRKIKLDSARIDSIARSYDTYHSIKYK